MTGCQVLLVLAASCSHICKLIMYIFTSYRFQVTSAKCLPLPACTFRHQQRGSQHPLQHPLQHQATTLVRHAEQQCQQHLPCS